jgi:hypothetical protein
VIYRTRVAFSVNGDMLLMAMSSIMCCRNGVTFNSSLNSRLLDSTQAQS